MKKYLKKIFAICMLVIMLVCNSITLFASETSYEYIINYKNTADGSLTRDRVITSVKDCAFINVGGRVYEVYCYVDGEVLQLNTSNYLVQVVSERYDAKNDEWVKYASGAPYIKMTSALECVGGISKYNNSEEFKKAIEEQAVTPPSSEEPSTEEPTEQPTEEPPTEEPPTEEPPTEEPPTENIDYGIACNLVGDLIGNTKEFTPQAVMAIFVVCLVLECLSHIASALLSVGGMK